LSGLKREDYQNCFVHNDMQFSNLHVDLGLGFFFVCFSSFNILCMFYWQHCMRAKCQYLSYSEGDFEVFHLALMEVKLGMEQRTIATPQCDISPPSVHAV